MNICSYCGRENSNGVVNCQGCGTELTVPPMPEISPGENFQPKFIDFSQLNEAITIAEGYPYPDWEKIREYTGQNVKRSHWGEAWREAGLQWLEKFRTAFDPNYFLNESNNFFLVSRQDKNGRQEILKFVEDVRQQLQNRLRGVKLQETFGKQVILIFEEVEDYYRYISYFYPDGNHTLSWGVFLNRGYGHIALPFYDHKNIRAMLTHELAHNALFTLPVPRWLNEGIAEVFESQISRTRGTGFDADMDLADQHRAYWTPENIQSFWSGKAFHSLESSKLSYSLANILINLIAREKGDFKIFLQNAYYADAGEAAFVKAYGKNLGQIAGIFLGNGDWNPKPEIKNPELK